MNEPPPPYVPPQLPETIAIPIQLVESWLQLAPSTYVDIKLTRMDWDNLFNAIHNLGVAQNQLGSCILHYSNGNLPSANQSLYEAQKAVIDSQNALRTLFAAVMASATRGKSHGG